MVNSEPPGFIIGTARAQTAVNEKQEISIAVRNASRGVSIYLPRKNALSAQPIEWTRKSNLSQALPISPNAASMLASLLTSQGTTSLLPTLSASGRTRFSSASP